MSAESGGGGVSVSLPIQTNEGLSCHPPPPCTHCPGHPGEPASGPPSSSPASTSASSPASASASSPASGGHGYFCPAGPQHGTSTPASSRQIEFQPMTPL